MSHTLPMRIMVIGTSGSGKTSMGKQLAQALGYQHIEMDSLYWGPNWQAVPPEVFKSAVDKATTGPCWVADGNYSAVRDVLWPRATHVVWLNFGRMTVLRRIVWRTLSRAITRERLFSGNRESLRMSLLSKESVILWSMQTWHKNRLRYSLLRNDPAYAHLHWTELCNPKHTQAIVAALTSAAVASTPPDDKEHL
ncbi:shikimate kinase [Lampropedia aestuarii]